MIGLEAAILSERYGTVNQLDQIVGQALARLLTVPSTYVCGTISGRISVSEGNLKAAYL